MAVSSSIPAVALVGNSSPIGAVSLGNSLGKLNVNKTGALTSTAVTAAQAVLTYTVTAGKTLYITGIELEAKLSVISALAVALGTASLSIGGVLQNTFNLMNMTTAKVDRVFMTFSEPIAITAATVVSIICTPMHSRTAAGSTSPSSRLIPTAVQSSLMLSIRELSVTRSGLV